MKASSEKSSTTTSPTATRAANEPFFTKAGGGNFLAPATGSAAPAVQRKMAVNKPADKFEQEADSMAEKVMRMPAPARAKEEEKLQHEADNKLQKKEEETTRETPASEEKLQRKDDGTPAADTNAQAAIQDKTAGGQPLPSDLRGYMEPRFGADFSNVRIHSDAESASLSNQLSARAFTYQNHIFFSRDQYQPGTSEGRQLLAHELTHTVQQGHAINRKAGISVPDTGEDALTAIQKAPAVGGSQPLSSSEVVNISSGTFNPSQKVKDEIAAQGHKGLMVRVVRKGLSDEGQIRIRGDGGNGYDSIGKGAMPLLNPWVQQLGGMYLNFKIKNNGVTEGYASRTQRGGNKNDWLRALKENPAMLGGLGLRVENLPSPVNEFDGAKLTLGVTGLKVEVGGFAVGYFDISLEDTNKPKIRGTANINVGMTTGQLQLGNTEGKLTGQGSLAVNFKGLAGSANVKYNLDGSIDIRGRVAYNANKLSGEVELVATDADSAKHFTREAIAAAGGIGTAQDARPPAQVPPPKPGKKDRGLAAVGQLNFNLTRWFAGTVNVVVDGNGKVTVIGKITPPAEIELFKQRDWDKELIKLEARAYYGIPVVGNLNLFANISLHALASLGPAKIYQIEILGTYSTDPDIQKNIQISGSINISAFAGLRLRAEGGAGIEIASHDLKFGVGLNADVGVKAYADARPTIGYREPGIFFISGTLEMVAQPMLGLGGDFFIQLSTPWWSPLSDDKWTWPMFSKEWPLSDPIGINASIKDYELGSGKVPDVELKKPEFDPAKFMTSMVDRTLPDKTGGAGAGQGTFKEDGSVPKPIVPPKKPAPKKADGKPGKKGPPPKLGKSAVPDPKAAKDQATAKILQNAAKSLTTLKGKAPFARDGLDKELTTIKGQVSGIDFDVLLTVKKWRITPKAGDKTGKGLELSAKEVGKKDKKDERTKEQKKLAVHQAVIETQQEMRQKGATAKTVRATLPGIQAKYRLSNLELVKESKAHYHILAKINPDEHGSSTVLPDDEAEVSDAIWAQVEPILLARSATPAITRLSGISRNHMITTFNNYIDKSPAGIAGKARANSIVTSRVASAMSATHGDAIYRNLQLASRAVMDLYPIGALSLQVHHQEGVAENPETFPRTRYQRIRAGVNRRIQGLPPAELANVVNVPAMVTQIALGEFQNDLEAKPGVLAEVNMIVLTQELHTGSSGTHHQP